jgi:predicted nucleic acid-binding protein
VAGRRTRLRVLLADKSALEWARRDARARAEFLALRSAHVIAACHMTALEICYWARDQKDLEALLAGQRALEWLPVSEAAMDGALEVQRLLAQHRGNGHRRPIPDLIIAATAELHGAEVLHVDGADGASLRPARRDRSSDPAGCLPIVRPTRDDGGMSTRRAGPTKGADP